MQKQNNCARNMLWINIFIFSVLLAVISAIQSPVVETTHGKVRGFTVSRESKLVNKFLGIPFAKPPIGGLRMKKPEKPDKWTDVLDAKKYSHSCIETAIYKLPPYFTELSDPYEQNEDCLYLNIIIPGDIEEAIKNPKPVMFWIYGGGYFLGNANFYPVDGLAVSGDVIVVTSNYRLGLFGFASSDDDIIPGNVGLFDQSAALMWVNENIASFGGDVSRITIFGQSAGADSVFNHLVSPVSKDLFSRAIIQSTPTWNNRSTTAKQFGILKDAAKDFCPFNDNTNDFLTCLQKLSTVEFLNVSDTTLLQMYEPISIDGEFITDDTSKLLASGKFDQSKKVMVGYTGEDGEIFTRYVTTKWNQSRIEGLSVEDAKETFPFVLDFHYKNLGGVKNKVLMENLLYQNYISCNKDDPFGISRAVLDMYTHSTFGSKSFEIADYITKYGGTVFLYQFDHMIEAFRESELHDSKIKHLAGHGGEIVYMFDTLERMVDFGRKVRPEDRGISENIKRIFAEFAHTGQPTYLTSSGEIAKWKPYTENHKEYFKFTAELTEDSADVVPKRIQKLMALWNSVLPQIQEMETCDTELFLGQKPKDEHENEDIQGTCDGDSCGNP